MIRKALINLLFALSLMLAPWIQFTGLAMVAHAQPATPSPELVGEVPPWNGIVVEYVDAMQVPDSNPNEIVFITLNQGAGCGGGTPASAWKMTLDPDTGKMISVTHKQSLSLIQQARGSLFESSDGTLFSGGGWCGPKPPYYSTDTGETWQPANVGVHPPKSTFSFAEFNGNVYASTGYETPNYGQVYRWLGDSGPDYWELVLDIAPPRTIIGPMTVYQDHLFVGSKVYWTGGSGCESSVPVYVSSDGDTFDATTGIPPCYSVNYLLVIGNRLVARASNYFDTTEQYMYSWNDNTGVWEEIGAYDLGNRPWQTMVSLNGALYAYGQAPGDASAGIYQSVDVGQNWQQVAVLEDPDVHSMAVHDNTIYLGTYSDANDVAYIYRWQATTLQVQPAGDAEIYPGDTIEVELSIQGADDLYGAQAMCTIDPAILELQDGAFGDFFDPAHRIVGADEADPAAGTWFGALSLQNPAEPLAGDGHFATLTYRALSTGTTTIACDVLFSDRDGFELPVAAVDGSVTVLPFGSISGTVTYQGRLAHNNISITATGPVVRTTTTDEGGDFALGDLKAGTYTVTADAPRYLPSCDAVQVYSGEMTLMGASRLLGGDLNDDDDINIGDATLLTANFGLSVPPADARADINDDGVVDVRDLAILGGNYELSGCQVW